MELAINHAVERASVWALPTQPISPSYIEIGMSYFYKVYEHIILFPLSRLYLFGPSFGGFGFWAGLGLPDICAQKTHLATDFWKEHPLECITIVGKNFYSIVVLLETLFYFFMIWTIIKYIFTWFTKSNKKRKEK